MNRVTIKDLYWEVNQDEQNSKVCDSYNWCVYKDIEIVPRKLVEMIIERLKRNISSCENDSYAGFTLTDVLQYAESLLQQFEEDM